MDINKISNVQTAESLIKAKQAPVSAQPEEKQQTDFVSSEASQAARAYATAQIRPTKNVNFEGKYEKIAETIKTTTNPSKVKLSFDEVANLLERNGYKLRQGKGSHYVLDLPDQRPLTIVKPHGSHDYIHPETIKALKVLLNQG